MWWWLLDIEPLGVKACHLRSRSVVLNDCEFKKNVLMHDLKRIKSHNIVALTSVRGRGIPLSSPRFSCVGGGHLLPLGKTWDRILDKTSGKTRGYPSERTRDYRPGISPERDQGVSLERTKNQVVAPPPFEQTNKLKTLPFLVLRTWTPIMRS